MFFSSASITVLLLYGLKISHVIVPLSTLISLMQIKKLVDYFFLLTYEISNHLPSIIAWYIEFLTDNFMLFFL